MVESGHPPTHYEVLGLSQALVDEEADPTHIIKRAYHRTLLRNHPDKAASSNSASTTRHTERFTTTATVDQISEAFRVLTSPRLRLEYNEYLARSHRAGPGEQTFQTGIENVDLDDLDFDASAGRWSRSCRCGNPKGFSFAESDLEEVEDEGNLIVGCQDCSLWLKVHFAVLNDDEGVGST
jgi:curved DNA-binding protein CbpA